MIATDVRFTDTALFPLHAEAITDTVAIMVVTVEDTAVIMAEVTAAMVEVITEATVVVVVAV